MLRRPHTGFASIYQLNRYDVTVETLENPLGQTLKTLFLGKWTVAFLLSAGGYPRIGVAIRG